jgi:hypothetical protein
MSDISVGGCSAAGAAEGSRIQKRLKWRLKLPYVAAARKRRGWKNLRLIAGVRSFGQAGIFHLCCPEDGRAKMGVSINV